MLFRALAKAVGPSAVPAKTWLTADRLTAALRVLLVTELIGAAFIIAGTYGLIVPLPRATSTDFLSFYAAGKLATHGAAAEAYDHGLHWAAERAVAGASIEYISFLYPPPFLLLCAGLARLPYLAAFFAFELLTLPLWTSALWRLTAPLGWRTSLILTALAAYPAALFNFGVGQNGFLTAGLIGWGLLLLDRRPFLAGILFGALCYKPHWGLLIPVALASGRYWRTIAAAAVAALAINLLALLVLGPSSFIAFWHAFSGSHTLYESGRVDFAAFINAFGIMNLWGAPLRLVYAAQAATGLAAAAAVAWVWSRKSANLPLRMAALASASLIAVPLALFYDLTLAALAIAGLTINGTRHGFLRGERLILIFNFLVPLAARGFAYKWHLPLALIGDAAMLGLSVWPRERTNKEELLF